MKPENENISFYNEIASDYDAILDTEIRDGLYLIDNDVVVVDDDDTLALGVAVWW